MKWPFRRKREPDAYLEPLEPAERPPGEGWRHWFELSDRAAHNPPWNYEWVELWRPTWGEIRTTRSADIPYEMNGPGFWWRPCGDPATHPAVIECE